MPAFQEVALELGLDDSIGQDEMTPDFVATATLDKVQGKPFHLDTVRGLGTTFNSACVSDDRSRLRCTFWMWHFENQQRGLELQFEKIGNGRHAWIGVGDTYMSQMKLRRLDN